MCAQKREKRPHQVLANAQHQRRQVLKQHLLQAPPHAQAAPPTPRAIWLLQLRPRTLQGLMHLCQASCTMQPTPQALRTRLPGQSSLSSLPLQAPPPLAPQPRSPPWPQLNPMPRRLLLWRNLIHYPKQVAVGKLHSDHPCHHQQHLQQKHPDQSQWTLLYSSKFHMKSRVDKSQL